MITQEQSFWGWKTNSLNGPVGGAGHFLKQQKIESTGGFELGLELVVKAHLQGFKVMETPTVWTDRQAGKSNFKIIEWLPSYLKWYFMTFLK